MKAFTLIELIITLLIMALLVSGIVAVLNVANISWNSNMGMLELQQQARLAIDGMTRETRQSRPSGVTVSLAGARLDFYIPGSVEVISYYIANNQLIRQHPAGVEKNIANNISNINFCCNGPGGCSDCANARMLSIDLEVTKTVRNAPIIFSLKEQVKLRNE